MGITQDTYHEVFDLAQRGTHAFGERCNVHVAWMSVYPEWIFISSSWTGNGWESNLDRPGQVYVTLVEVRYSKI
jgi:hypothetical protein